MEYISGVADFSKNAKFVPTKAFSDTEKNVYSDNNVILYGTVQETKHTKTMSLDDTLITYTPTSHTLDFTCGSSGIHRLFFTFFGSAFVFSTNLDFLVNTDKKPFILLGNSSLRNISEVKYGKCGTFSSEGLKFY